MGDLVKRLRARKAYWVGAGMDPDELCYEAAARIEALEARVAAADALAGAVDAPDQSDGSQGRYHYDWQRIDDALATYHATKEGQSGRDRQRCPHCQDRDGQDRRNNTEATGQAQERIGGIEGARRQTDSRRTERDRAQGCEREVGLMDHPLESVAVANTFIKRYGGVSPITHMKLQKLCYYAYGWWLALCPDEPVLMQSKPQVWKLGPVFQPIYSAFASHRNQRILEAKKLNPFAPASEIEKSDANESQVIDWIWDRYGHFSAVQLSDMTHETGTPWRKKVEECEYRVPRFLELSDDEIRPYFVDLARKEGFIKESA